MIRIPKSVISFGALALAAGALTLAVPRAAHAIAAALVQVSNPPASPANTEDTSRQANQLVQLYCNAPASINSCSLVPASGPAYVVPNNQSLVITSADMFPVSESFSNNNSVQVYLVGLVGNVVYHQWLVGPSTNSVQFQYPSGIVLPPGTEVGTIVGAIVNFQLNGYLTTN